MALKYPAETFSEAVDLAIDGSNKLYDFVNGDINTTISTDGGVIPSVAKALNEASAYKTPIAWNNGENQTDLMQPRDYQGVVYVPRTVPVTLGAAPTLGSGGDWRFFGDAILRQELVQPVATFNNVADMKADSTLIVGRKARTLGYYTPGDGGGNDYEIGTGFGTDDGGSVIDLAGSGLQAKGLFVDGVVNINQFGAVNDDSETNSSSVAIINAIDFGLQIGAKIVAYGNYYLSTGGIELKCDVDFSGATLECEGTYTADAFFKFTSNSSRKNLDFGKVLATGGYHLNTNNWSQNNCGFCQESGSFFDTRFTFVSISNFKVNISLRPGLGGLCAYNTFSGEIIQDAFKNIEIYPTDDGFVNQNLFDVRRLRNNSSSVEGWGLYTAKDPVGGSAPPGSPNENIFLHTALEGTGSKCIFSLNSSTTFISCRFENRPNNSIQIEQTGTPNATTNTQFLFPFFLDLYDGKIQLIDQAVPPTFYGYNLMYSVTSSADPVISVGSRFSNNVPSMEVLSTINGPTGRNRPSVTFSGRGIGVYDSFQPAAGQDSELKIEISGYVGGLPSIKFTDSGASIFDYGDEVRLQGPVSLREANLYSSGTGGRLTATRVGQQQFDTTLGKPIWWNGTNWVDAAGAVV